MATTNEVIQKFEEEKAALKAKAVEETKSITSKLEIKASEFNTANADIHSNFGEAVKSFRENYPKSFPTAEDIRALITKERKRLDGTLEGDISKPKDFLYNLEETFLKNNCYESPTLEALEAPEGSSREMGLILDQIKARAEAFKIFNGDEEIKSAVAQLHAIETARVYAVTRRIIDEDSPTTRAEAAKHHPDEYNFIVSLADLGDYEKSDDRLAEIFDLSRNLFEPLNTNDNSVAILEKIKKLKGLTAESTGPLFDKYISDVIIAHEENQKINIDLKSEVDFIEAKILEAKSKYREYLAPFNDALSNTKIADVFNPPLPNGTIRLDIHQIKELTKYLVDNHKAVHADAINFFANELEKNTNEKNTNEKNTNPTPIILVENAKLFFPAQETKGNYTRVSSAIAQEKVLKGWKTKLVEGVEKATEKVAAENLGTLLAGLTLNPLSLTEETLRKFNLDTLTGALSYLNTKLTQSTPSDPLEIGLMAKLERLIIKKVADQGLGFTLLRKKEGKKAHVPIYFTPSSSIEGKDLIDTMVRDRDLLGETWQAFRSNTSPKKIQGRKDETPLIKFKNQGHKDNEEGGSSAYIYSELRAATLLSIQKGYESFADGTIPEENDKEKKDHAVNDFQISDDYGDILSAISPAEYCALLSSVPVKERGLKLKDLLLKERKGKYEEEVNSQGVKRYKARNGRGGFVTAERLQHFQARLRPFLGIWGAPNADAEIPTKLSTSKIPPSLWSLGNETLDNIGEPLSKWTAETFKIIEELESDEIIEELKNLYSNPDAISAKLAVASRMRRKLVSDIHSIDSKAIKNVAAEKMGVNLSKNYGEFYGPASAKLQEKRAAFDRDVLQGERVRSQNIGRSSTDSELTLSTSEAIKGSVKNYKKDQDSPAMIVLKIMSPFHLNPVKQLLSDSISGFIAKNSITTSGKGLVNLLWGSEKAAEHREFINEGVNKNLEKFFETSLLLDEERASKNDLSLDDTILNQYTDVSSSELSDTRITPFSVRDSSFYAAVLVGKRVNPVLEGLKQIRIQGGKTKRYIQENGEPTLNCPTKVRETILKEIDADRKRYKNLRKQLIMSILLESTISPRDTKLGLEAVNHLLIADKEKLFTSTEMMQLTEKLTHQPIGFASQTTSEYFPVLQKKKRDLEALVESTPINNSSHSIQLQIRTSPQKGIDKVGKEQVFFNLLSVGENITVKTRDPGFEPPILLSQVDVYALFVDYFLNDDEEPHQFLDHFNILSANCAKKEIKLDGALSDHKGNSVLGGLLDTLIHIHSEDDDVMDSIENLLKNTSPDNIYTDWLKKLDKAKKAKAKEKAKKAKKAKEALLVGYDDTKTGESTKSPQAKKHQPSKSLNK